MLDLEPNGLQLRPNAVNLTLPVAAAGVADAARLRLCYLNQVWREGGREGGRERG